MIRGIGVGVGVRGSGSGSGREMPSPSPPHRSGDRVSLSGPSSIAIPRLESLNTLIKVDYIPLWFIMGINWTVDII